MRFLTSHGGIYLGKALFFMLCLIQGFDNAHARCIFAHHAHQVIHPLLQGGIERNAAAGDQVYQRAHQRQHGDEHQ